MWTVEGQGVFAQHCQLWQALWMWQINLDTQQGSSRVPGLRSSVSSDPHVVGNAIPVP